MSEEANRRLYTGAVYRSKGREKGNIGLKLHFDVMELLTRQHKGTEATRFNRNQRFVCYGKTYR